MGNNCANRSIKCNVKSCENHCGEHNYCSLDCVCIGTHESDPAIVPCTDCQSFVNVNPEEQRKAAEKAKQQGQSTF